MAVTNAFALIFVILGAFLAGPGDEAIPKGEVVPKVVCKGASGFTYAVYLPKNYGPSKKWPVLYCFDPAARGSVPVDLFKSGAEEYGYIVVGSNDSRNGPDVPLQSIIEAMWNDTHSRFSIDEKRVYAAGFSGGARVAVAFSYWKGANVAGVIACSGGFPGNRKPEKDVPFVFFGTAGIEDFNFPEMFNLADSLDFFKVPNRFEVFDGEHQWAPADVCTEAIEWMEIRAMRSGTLERRPSLIQKIRYSLEAKAQKAESSGKTYDAWRAYRSLAVDFEGLVDTAQDTAKEAAIRGSKAFKAQLKQTKDEIKKQESMTRSLERLKAVATRPGPSSSQADTGFQPPAVPSPAGSGSPPTFPQTDDATGSQGQSRLSAASDLRRELKDLRKKSSDKSETPERIVATRVLNGFFVGCFETAELYKSTRRFDLAAANLEIASEIRPQSAGIAYSLAQAYALAGDKSKALAALRNAVDNGWKDAEAIEKEKAFDQLRGESEYTKVMTALKERKQ